MIAEVAFDLPLGHPFSYRVPPALTLTAGQRVIAPLRGAERVGLVVGVHDASDDNLKPLLRLVDPTPLLTPDRLDLLRWIAAESLSGLGSTALALLPPPAAEAFGAAVRTSGGIDGSTEGSRAPEVLIGVGREAKLLERITESGRPALVLTADVESATRWAQRLGKIERTVRFDSGVSDAERARAWAELAATRARLAVGTRSALLAPLPPGATIALIDEHEPAHKPPGAPRVHSREIVLERAAREHLHAVLTSATPSAEMWWRCDRSLAARAGAVAGPWPSVSIADTRGIARREALTPALVRAIRDTLAAGRRVFLGVSRRTSMLGCDECGAVLRCAHCALALAYSPAGRTLACRLCGERTPIVNTCPACDGRRLAPFGWGVERVEHAVRKHFARARVVRWEPDAVRGPIAEARRAAAAGAEIVIGTRGALRLFGPASLGLAGFVSPDQLLGLPDFRAAERAFSLLWAAAERVRPDGAVVVQSQNPSHYALDAIVKQDLGRFYAPELAFRAELGYPPFRRIAIVTVRSTSPAERAAAADEIVVALRGAQLTVYPPVADRRDHLRSVVVKGDQDLPRRLAEVNMTAQARPKRRVIIEVEVDPVEWPS